MPTNTKRSVHRVASFIARSLTSPDAPGPTAPTLNTGPTIPTVTPIARGTTRRRSRLPTAVRVLITLLCLSNAGDKLTLSRDPDTAKFPCPCGSSNHARVNPDKIRTLCARKVHPPPAARTECPDSDVDEPLISHHTDITAGPSASQERPVKLYSVQLSTHTAQYEDPSHVDEDYQPAHMVQDPDPHRPNPIATASRDPLPLPHPASSCYPAVEPTDTLLYMYLPEDEDEDESQVVVAAMEDERGLAIDGPDVPGASEEWPGPAPPSASAPKEGPDDRWIRRPQTRPRPHNH